MLEYECTLPDKELLKCDKDSCEGCPNVKIHKKRKIKTICKTDKIKENKFQTVLSKPLKTKHIHIAEPIKNKKDIKTIEEYLKEHNERDYVVWVLGINTGLRVSDIVGLNVSDVVDKTHITIIEKKTQKRKSIYINDKLKKVLKEYTKGRNLNEPLFLGKQGYRLNRRQVHRFIINACYALGIKIKASTHTMRKSFGYHHYQKFKDPIILQKIFNHSSITITLRYIGVEQDEIDNSYRNFEL